MDDSTSSASANHPFLEAPSETLNVEKAIANLIEQTSPKLSPQIENNVERIQSSITPVKFSFNRWTARANVPAPEPANVSEFRGFPRAG
jgi:hypothetical protein